MEKKFLIPCKGMRVKDPRTMEQLAAEGEFKPWIGPEGRYWRRRVNCGDALIGKPPTPERKITRNNKEEKDNDNIV